MPVQSAERAMPVSVAGDRIASQIFPAAATSSTMARRFVARVCREWGAPALVMDAELIVTELVENAVRHGRTGCEVTVELSARGLQIAVQDGSLLPPRRLNRTPTEPGGRGLLLVERLSRAWGFELHDAGKTVWALVAEPGGHNGDGKPPRG